MGIETTTPGLRDQCSASELQRLDDGLLFIQSNHYYVNNCNSQSNVTRMWFTSIERKVYQKTKIYITRCINDIIVKRMKFLVFLFLPFIYCIIFRLQLWCQENILRVKITKSKNRNKMSSDGKFKNYVDQYKEITFRINIPY